MPDHPPEAYRRDDSNKRSITGLSRYILELDIGILSGALAPLEDRTTAQVLSFKIYIKLMAQLGIKSNK